MTGSHRGEGGIDPGPPPDASSPGSGSPGEAARSGGASGAEPASAETILPGSRSSGHPARAYVIRRIIAPGGMGTVYEAVQEKPRRSSRGVIAPGQPDGG